MGDYIENESEARYNYDEAGEVAEQDTYDNREAEAYEEKNVEQEGLEEQVADEPAVEEETTNTEENAEENFEEQNTEEQVNEETTETEETEEQVVEEVTPAVDNNDQEDRSLEMAATLDITLENRTNSETVFAYVTGRAIDHGNKVCFIKANGYEPFYPESPPKVGTPLPVDCAIRLGGPGSTTTVTIPHIAGGRIWFSVESELTFLLNPGPGVAEPSVTNPTDPSIDINWGFCEFTYTKDQLYANISYVDFVSLPISMTLTPASGEPQTVQGLAADGLEQIKEGLLNIADNAEDWASLIQEKDGNLLRILSPNNARVMTHGKTFQDYYDAYVDSVWEKYSSESMFVDTQAKWGVLEGKVEGDALVFEGHGSFSKPNTGDIFSCSTGPFRDNREAMGPLTARISAALNRSTLHKNAYQPTNEQVSEFYTEAVSNHYARLVHAANLDGRGYAFPYDDVPAPGDVDQSGFVSGYPQAFSVSVG